MCSSLASIHVLVTKFKEEMFLKTKNHHLQSFVSPSAYDTAWLAMIPHEMEHNRPLFKGCLEWLLNNQKENGSWGESVNGLPTIDALPATLASMAVLRKWGTGAENIEKGLKFILANTEDMLQDDHHHLPRWFCIVFPATIQLAESFGLDLKFSDHIKSIISQISHGRQQFFSMEEIVDKWQYPPLLAYLETFPFAQHDINQETINKHLSEDGSLFQSPSATAQAYISTGNHKCLGYLTSLVQKCPNGVPPKYPIDEELIELSMVDQVQKLGLSEYFTEEIESILRNVYRSYMDQESLQDDNMNMLAEKLYKDSLAFRLFRMHGFNISPRTFCWFLYYDEILDHLENNCAQFTSSLYNVYKATDLMFFGENEVDEARMWIEQNKEGPLWNGKASYYRLSCIHNMDLMQLAVENYVFRQMIYQNELNELKRWSKKWGLTEMGFGREKTMYCYFAIAASTSLPHDSMIRMLVAKSAIVITVADDFFDMRGSLDELHILIEAIHRWDGKGLIGPSKVIFDVLDDLVRDSTKSLVLGNIDIIEDFRNLWRETFNSWLTETTWGKNGYIPSVDEYMETGMISIATHILVLTSSCFLNPSIPKNKVKPQTYEDITQSLMATARLLNDIQSYEQKEQEEGKMNLVLLHFKDNPDASMDDSVNLVKKFMDWKRKELLKHVFTNDRSDFPKQWNFLHLSCFKVFQMLYSSSNLYDTEAELQLHIEKAIYLPPKHELPICLKPQTTLPPLPQKGNLTINGGYARNPPRRYVHGCMSIRFHQLPKKPMRNLTLEVFCSSMSRICFM
ncbi:hypothetical protein L1887_17307 [Cichorium endivia]|nr:hypothetical protein L1887_17307 [Cichorium endivia]